MPKVSVEMKEQMKQDHKKMSIKQMIDKYGVSKATIHRAVGKESFSIKESVASVNVPTTEDSSGFLADILDGKVKDKEQTKQNSPQPVFDEEKSKNQERAMEKLADHLFSDEPVIPKPKQPKGIVETLINPPKNEIDTSIQDKNALIQRIILNVDNFLPLFKFIDNKESFIKGLPNKSIPDLKSLLDMMETTRTTINLATQIKSTFFIASRGVEIAGARFLRLRTEGLTDALLQQREELDMIFREIAIDYAPMFKITTRPELRLGILFATTLVQTDNSNRIRDIMSHRQAPENPEKKYDDL